MSEADVIPILCAMLLGGSPEVRVPYDLHAGDTYVRVDCVTETHAIEVGLDARRSSYDSLIQAMFAAEVTELAPMVVLIDTDGVEDSAEYVVETATRAAGVAYRVYDLDALIRYQMTLPFRLARDRILGVEPGA